MLNHILLGRNVLCIALNNHSLRFATLINFPLVGLPLAKQFPRFVSALTNPYTFTYTHNRSRSGTLHFTQPTAPNSFPTHLPNTYGITLSLAEAIAL